MKFSLICLLISLGRTHKNVSHKLSSFWKDRTENILPHAMTSHAIYLRSTVVFCVFPLYLENICKNLESLWKWFGLFFILFDWYIMMRNCHMGYKFISGTKNPKFKCIQITTHKNNGQSVSLQWNMVCAANWKGLIPAKTIQMQTSTLWTSIIAASIQLRAGSLKFQHGIYDFKKITFDCSCHKLQI